MRRAAQSPPSARRFIIALRLWARTMIAHHAALAPNRPLGSRPGEIVLHHGVRFLALAAALALPADQVVARQRAVGDEAEQLVAAQPRKAHRREARRLTFASGDRRSK